MTTDIAHYQGRITRGFRQQAEPLCAALAALLMPMAAPNFVPRALQMLRASAGSPSSLPVCPACHGWAGQCFSRRAGSREPFQNQYGFITRNEPHPLHVELIDHGTRVTEHLAPSVFWISSRSLAMRSQL
jgi:hypothetical protein